MSCAPCGPGRSLKVFACAVHGRCVQAKHPEGVASCEGCADHVPLSKDTITANRAAILQIPRAGAIHVDALTRELVLAGLPPGVNVYRSGGSVVLAWELPGELTPEQSSLVRSIVEAHAPAVSTADDRGELPPRIVPAIVAVLASLPPVALAGAPPWARAILVEAMARIRASFAGHAER